jgi:hypothetical protein
MKKYYRLVMLCLMAACVGQDATAPATRRVPDLAGKWAMTLREGVVETSYGVRCGGRGTLVIDTLGASGDIPARASFSGLCERTGNRGFQSSFSAAGEFVVPASGDSIVFVGGSCRLFGAVDDMTVPSPRQMAGTGECRGISAAGLTVELQWSAVKQ